MTELWNLLNLTGGNSLVYDEMVNICTEKGLIVHEMDFCSKAKGLCIGNYIFINKSLEQREKLCILAEEMGHYFTTTGNIIDKSKKGNNKQENTARIFAYDLLIGIEGLVSVWNLGAENTADASEILGVSEEFFTDALDYYKRKYGNYTEINGYRIIFQPYIVVKKLNTAEI